jgi:hypothetical protein
MFVEQLTHVTARRFFQPGAKFMQFWEAAMSLGFAVDLFLNPIIFVEEGLTSARAMHPELQHNTRNDAPALIYIALAMGAPAC